PVSDAGDSPFYIDLGWNWLKHGVYGLIVNGHLTSVDMRTPGYPAFLAGIFALAGKSERSVMFAQASVDLLTCFGIGLIAARLASPPIRKRAAIAALWLAALCPFTANYTAAVLTETLAICLTAVAMLALLEPQAFTKSSYAQANRASLSPWLLGGLAVGFGTLVRPEAPLLLLAAGAVLVAKWHQPTNWRRLLRASILMAIGMLLPIMPWAARNWRTLHKTQFLAPRYGELPGELAPRGFDAWTHTWLWRFRDAFAVNWNLDSNRIDPANIPSSAFDTPEERAQVMQLLEAYNETITLTPDEDRAFGQIARRRTARHPLRTWATIPIRRSLALWFAPRIELLPYTGQIFPIAKEWDEDREDLSVSIALVSINIAYLALAAAGAWIGLRSPRIRTATAFLVTYIAVRTLFISRFAETPEPRYVLECFPAVIALAGLAIARIRSPQPVPDGSSPDKSAEIALSRGLRA
ncbi:MAG: glycosyltransferase family 39 protein, partial [Acidobacteriota bacterium]|nr:glycosyltransferase family 39 protein [Acidobacteriota bacterium]